MRDKVTVYPTFIKNPTSERRYYYTELLAEDVPADIEDQIAAGSTEYRKWTSLNKSYPGTRYYKLTIVAGVNYQSSMTEDKLISSAKTWSGREITGFETIGKAGDTASNCTTSDFQKAFFENDKDGILNKHGRVEYYMPRKMNTITLVMDGGKVEGIEKLDNYKISGVNYIGTYLYNQMIKLPNSEDIELKQAEFEGWFLDEEYKTPYVVGKMPVNGLVLYAKYKYFSVNVKYYDGELIKNNFYNFNEFLSKHDLEGTDYENLKVGDEVEGKGIFQGWRYYANNSNVLIEFALNLELVDTEYNIHATWKDKKYTVTFMEDKAEGDFSELTSMEVVSGGKNTLALNKKRTPVLSLEGYDFIGWSKTSNDTEVNFNAATRIVEDIVVYPIWNRIKVNVTYNANNGKMTESNKKVTLYHGQSFDEINETLLDKDSVTREGYIFRGWETEDKEMFQTDQLIKEDTILYAKW
ncbi:MAG: InlB B-repeat-containing protein, partial [Coprobacillaceae bacterium]